MKRDIAIDYLRSWITVSVVAHHAALAYNTFSRYDPGCYIKSTAPVVDAVRWMPLDILVAWNDLFFMPLMFLISGIFVAPSIERKGIAYFVADRAKRLGIPFIISVTLLSPLAYYPSWLSSESVSQGNFLYRFFTVDGWSSGPAWFIWVLLAFCGIAAAAFLFIPNLMRRLSWSPSSPRSLVIVLLAVSLLTTIPMRLFVSSADWASPAGPLHFQTWRILLYFAWFMMGFALGGTSPERSISRKNLKHWPLWLVLGALSYMTHATLEAPLACFSDMPPWQMNVLQATAYSLCCTFTSIGLLGLARSCFRTSRPLPDSLTNNAYGIYIFHYALVTWMQYLLLSQPLAAAFKFLISFSFALVGSWLLTSLLRKTPAKRFL